MIDENMSIKKWRKNRAPRRILIIRVQALGDLFITLPFVYDLKIKYPNAKIDLLVRTDYSMLPTQMNLFHQIHTLRGGTVSWKQKVFMLGLIPKLWFTRYEVVLDLQRNRMTRWVRRLLLPKAWTEFDRFSPKSALIRTQWSINQVGLGSFEMNVDFSKHFTKNQHVQQILEKNGWDGQSRLVILNPAGAFVTRNWDLARYGAFIKLWLSQKPQTLFVILGADKIAEKASFIKEKHPQQVIDLVGKTNLHQAYEIVLKADFMLTEDSGLGHFSWISGKKTLMILGSTRSDWTKPFGQHTASFDSSDLPCGDCMLATCLHDTLICLDRLTSEMVFESAWKLYTQP